MKKTYVLLIVVLSVFIGCQTNNEIVDDNKNVDEEEFVEDTTVVDFGCYNALWTKCNVGADNPWDYGDYFAWGETSPKETYDWTTYKYAEGYENALSQNILTKYCSKQTYGSKRFTDDLIALVAADDAATVNLGKEYFTPGQGDWEDLIAKTYWAWTTEYRGHKVSGFIVYKAKVSADAGYQGDNPAASYSLSDAHIFLPAAGMLGYHNEKFHSPGTCGRYWSHYLSKDYPTYAKCMEFEPSYAIPSASQDRCYGLSVRPIRHKK